MERDKALEMALGQIEKQFGKGAIMRMGENSHMQIESISTGALSLDIALGIGGLQRRLHEARCDPRGTTGSGKTASVDARCEAREKRGVCDFCIRIGEQGTELDRFPGGSGEVHDFSGAEASRHLCNRYFLHADSPPAFGTWWIMASAPHPRNQ